MCEVGDIILVNGYRNNDGVMSRHSFVVINDEGGKIQGLDYDIICNVMSSFKSEEHKSRKLSFNCNVLVKPSDSTIENGNNEEGYIKADQLYYFNEKKSNYVVIGKISNEVLERLFSLLAETNFPIRKYFNNL